MKYFAFLPTFSEFSVSSFLQFDEDDYKRSDHSTLKSSTSMSKVDNGPFSQIAEICKHLFLSSAKAISRERIKTLGITNIINCSRMIPNVKMDNVQYLEIHVHDNPGSNLGVYFDMVSDKVKDVALSGGKTLIHCYAGISRSPTLCMAYLMKDYNMTLHEAYLHVLNQRPVIRPNRGFLKQLTDYERHLHGRVTLHIKRIEDNAETCAKPEQKKDTKKKVSFPISTLTTVYAIAPLLKHSQRKDKQVEKDD